MLALAVTLRGTALPPGAGAPSPLAGAAFKEESYAGASRDAGAGAAARSQEQAVAGLRAASEPKHPAPAATLSGSIAPAGNRTDFAPGEAVSLRILLANETGRALLIGPGTPVLKVTGAAGGARDLPVSALAGRRLEPGGSVAVTAVIPAGPAPGWYSALLDVIELSDGSRTAIGAPGRLFFVRFPEGALRLGGLRVGKTATHEGVTLAVDEVTWSERETRIAFRIPAARAPAGFDLRLVADGAPTASLDLSYREVAGQIVGEAAFNPLSAATRTLAVEMGRFTGQVDGRMVDVAGPWRIAILEDAGG